MKQINKIMFNAKITPIKPLNNEFTLCKCYVLALGKNRNHSFIKEKTVNDALPTIYNIPVVGNLYLDENGEYRMGGHDMVLARDDNGKLIFKSVCIPVGTVPYQDNIHYEEIIDSKGNKSIYQVADVILWTGRYPDLYKAIYNDDIWFGQSMEIDVKESEKLKEDENYREIKKFSYSALCLLGKSDDKDYHVEPCFPNARVEPYQFSVDNDEFSNLMNEFKTKLTDCFQAIKNNKGGETKLTIEVCNSVLEEYGLLKEDLDFEITEEMTEEEFKSKIANYVSKIEDENSDEINDQEIDDNADTTESQITNEESEKEAKDNDENETEEKFSLNPKTYMEKAQVLSDSIRKLNIFKDIGCVFHYFSDFDDEFVYISRHFELKDKIYDDNVRTTYRFENGEAIFSENFETVIKRWLTETEAEELERQRNDYKDLKDFYNTRIEEDRMNEYDKILSEFSDLTGNDEFSAVLENKKRFESAEALKEKCFAIRGKTVVVPSTKKTDSAKARINYSEKSETEKLYGGLFAMFPPSGRK